MRMKKFLVKISLLALAVSSFSSFISTKQFGVSAVVVYTVPELISQVLDTTVEDVKFLNELVPKLKSEEDKNKILKFLKYKEFFDNARAVLPAVSDTEVSGETFDEKKQKFIDNNYPDSPQSSFNKGRSLILDFREAREQLRTRYKNIVRNDGMSPEDIFVVNTLIPRVQVIKKNPEGFVKALRALYCEELNKGLEINLDGKTERALDEAYLFHADVYKNQIENYDVKAEASKKAFKDRTGFEYDMTGATVESYGLEDLKKLAVEAKRSLDGIVETDFLGSSDKEVIDFYFKIFGKMLIDPVKADMKPVVVMQNGDMIGLPDSILQSYFGNSAQSNDKNSLIQGLCDLYQDTISASFGYGSCSIDPFNEPLSLPVLSLPSQGGGAVDPDLLIAGSSTPIGFDTPVSPSTPIGFGAPVSPSTPTGVEVASTPSAASVDFMPTGDPEIDAWHLDRVKRGIYNVDLDKIDSLYKSKPKEKEMGIQSLEYANEIAEIAKKDPCFKANLDFIYENAVHLYANSAITNELAWAFDNLKLILDQKKGTADEALYRRLYEHAAGRYSKKILDEVSRSSKKEEREENLSILGDAIGSIRESFKAQDINNGVSSTPLYSDYSLSDYLDQKSLAEYRKQNRTPKSKDITPGQEEVVSKKENITPEVNDGANSKFVNDYDSSTDYSSKAASDVESVTAGDTDNGGAAPTIIVEGSTKKGKEVSSKVEASKSSNKAKKVKEAKKFKEDSNEFSLFAQDETNKKKKLKAEKIERKKNKKKKNSGKVASKEEKIAVGTMKTLALNAEKKVLEFLAEKADLELKPKSLKPALFPMKRISLADGIKATEMILKVFNFFCNGLSKRQTFNNLSGADKAFLTNYVEVLARDLKVLKGYADNLLKIAEKTPNKFYDVGLYRMFRAQSKNFKNNVNSISEKMKSKNVKVLN